MIEPDLEHAIRDEQNKQIMQTFPSAALVATTLAGFLAYFAWGDIATEWILTWLGLFVSIMAYRFFIYIRYIQNVNKVGPGKSLRTHFTVGAIALGSCWLLAITLFLPQMTLTNQALSNVLFAGVAAGAVTSLSYIFVIAALYLSLILIPLAIVMGMTDSGLSFVSVMAVLFFFSLILMSKRFDEAFRHNTKMRFEANIANTLKQQSDKRLSLLFENSPLAIIEWDTEYKITDWNASAERLFGYSREKALGMSLNRLFFGEPTGVQRFVYDLLLNHKNLNRRFECITSTGETIQTDWFATTVVPDSEIQDSKFAVQIIDISQSKISKVKVLEKE